MSTANTLQCMSELHVREIRTCPALSGRAGRPRMARPRAEPHPDLERVLFSEAQISERISQIGRNVAKDFKDHQPLLLGALTGATIFMSGAILHGGNARNTCTSSRGTFGTVCDKTLCIVDLARSISPVPDGLELDFIRVSSYHGATTSSAGGSVDVGAGQKISVKGRHVLLVEDIIDTGKTALKLKDKIQAEGALSVKLVALLDKVERRECKIEPDYCCFPCPDEFVVGYGLDFNERYRSLPQIGVLKPALYQ